MRPYMNDFGASQCCYSDYDCDGFGRDDCFELALFVRRSFKALRRATGVQAIAGLRAFVH